MSEKRIEILETQIVAWWATAVAQAHWMVHARTPLPCLSSVEGEETLLDLGTAPPTEVWEGERSSLVLVN
jgi:hypothetical protein